MFFLLKPFFHALDTRDTRVRVLPNLAIDESMLDADGETLLEPHSTSYVSFLATQIADLIAFFESRHHRSRGEVTIGDDNHLNRTQMTPPPLNWGTPNTSGTWNSNHSTPRDNDAPEKPKSGVSIILHMFHKKLIIIVISSTLKPCYMASAPPIRLLRETATIKDVVRALNNFYDEFLEQNIRLNLDHANQEDVNDGELNKQNATRVT